MDIQIKGTKYEPAPEVITHTTKQIKSFEKFFKNNEPVRVYMELEHAVRGQKQGDVWRAELNVDHNGVRYRAESTKAKIDHAITTVVRDVGRELARARKRDHVLLRQGGAVVKSVLRGFQQ